MTEQDGSQSRPSMAVPLCRMYLLKSSRAAAASCSGYNDGKYGLGNLAGTYMAKAGAASILKTYLVR